jgi:hypothetical protein
LGFINRRGQEQVVHQSLLNFRNQYPYKDASPIGTELWNDLSGNEEAARTLGWIASSGERDERVCFFLNPFIDGGSGINSEKLKYYMKGKSDTSCDARTDRFDRRIGFTFLILQNDANESIKDVTLLFRENYLTKRFKKPNCLLLRYRRILST